VKKKTVCVFTGTRAEYGLLRPLMRLIRADAGLRLRVIAAGMHLSPEFGNTYREIIRDGFRIDHRVRLPLGDDSPLGTCRAAAAALEGVGSGYRKLRPDAVVILGDRYEALSAAIAASFMRIPIVHLHGGESTFGLIDEAIRHSITKMSWLHFTSTEKYRRRVIQLGENPGTVFNFGAIGLDNVYSMEFCSKDELSRLLGFDLSGKVAAVTFHPVTLDREPPSRQTSALLKALDSFPELKLVFTMPNADAGNAAVTWSIKKYAARNPLRARCFQSLGQLRYLSLLKNADIVVGNSSSGIIEAPSFHIPTVNVGNRQKGRVQGSSVINCPPAPASIASAIRKGLSPVFLRRCRSAGNPYGRGNTAPRILSVLKGFLKKTPDLEKKFLDIRF